MDSSKKISLKISACRAGNDGFSLDGYSESNQELSVEGSASCSTRDSHTAEDSYTYNDLNRETEYIDEKERRIIEYLDSLNVTLTQPKEKKDMFFDDNRRKLWQIAQSTRRVSEKKEESLFLTPQANEKRATEDVHRSASLSLNLSDSKFLQRRKKVSISCAISTESPAKINEHAGDVAISRSRLSKWCTMETEHDGGKSSLAQFQE